MKIETLRKLITEEIKYTEVLDKEDYILFIYIIEDCNNMFDIIKLLNEFGWNNQSSIDIINKVILTK